MSAVLPIEEDDRFQIYTASSGQKTFAVPFPFQDDDDIGIYYLSAGSWIKIAATAYVLTGAGEAAGGSVTLNTGRAEGEKVLVIGEAIITRITSIVRAGKFSSAATDNDLDRAVIIAQEQARELNRTLRMVREASIAFEVADDVAEGEVLIRSGNQLIGASLASVADATEGAAIVVALALKADLSYVDDELAIRDARLDTLDTDKADVADTVTLTGTATLTNKTLTSPVINTPALILPNDASQTTAGKLTYDAATGRLILGKGSGASAKLSEGAWEKLGLLTLAGASNQVITDLSAFWALRFTINADGVSSLNMQLQLSADNGSSFYTTGNHLFWYDGETGNTPGAGLSTTDTSLTIGVAGLGASRAELYGFNKTARKRVIGNKQNNAGTPNIYGFASEQATFTSACNALKLLPNSGTITATILIEGVRG